MQLVCVDSCGVWQNCNTPKGRGSQEPTVNVQKLGLRLFGFRCCLVMSDEWAVIYTDVVDGAVYRPVVNKRGEIELYDIFIGGRWMGSKRTLEQCEDRVQHLLMSA